MRSPQTLSEADRRIVAAWAADCAERVVGLFEAEAPADNRPRALIARARAFARGELNTAEEIGRRFVGGVPASEVTAPAAAAAARAAGEAQFPQHGRLLDREEPTGEGGLGRAGIAQLIPSHSARALRGVVLEPPLGQLGYRQLAGSRVSPRSAVDVGLDAGEPSQGVSFGQKVAGALCTAPACQ